MNTWTSPRRWIATWVLVAATAPATLQAATPAAPGEGFKRHLADLINAYRATHGLEPLSLAEDLIEIADEHSTSMAQRRQLSHQGFRDRFQRAASRICVENVAWNFPTPETLLEGWRQSPEHHRNLLEPKVARMGISMAARYVTFFACR